MNYKINREAIIFLDRDREVGYHTIAYDWQSGDLYAIRPLEYRILRFIYEHEPISKSTLRDVSGRTLGESQLDKIMEVLINKKIVFADEQ